MKQQVWRQSGINFYVDEDSNTQKRLPMGVFSLEFNKNMDSCFLRKMSDSFEFPYKVYGVNDVFIKRVQKTFEETTSNLGVLLNGVRGTGKTVTAQMIANNTGLPVVVISNNYDDKIVEFINQVNQDLCIFIDEYEKVFDKSKTLLTVMDGVFNNPLSRKVFILTTNYMNVEENLLQRPGRIRYKKEFTNIDKRIISEIIEDCLEQPEFASELLELLLKLDLVTIDIVKAFIQEVNIHKLSPTELFEDMNFKRREPSACTIVLKHDKTVVGKYTNFAKSETKRWFYLGVGDDVQFRGCWIGSVVDKKEDGSMLVKLDRERPLVGVKEIDEMLIVTESDDMKVFNEYFSQKPELLDSPVLTLHLTFEDIVSYAF